MEINEIILVTENRKGTETNALMTFHDYIIFAKNEESGTQLELAEHMVGLGRTVGNEKEWTEVFHAANKSISARYCMDEKQLAKFLQGYYNSTDQTWRFDSEMCSKVCLEKLIVLGIDTRGLRLSTGFNYEVQETRFEQGQILHNFNGNDYRVMEKLSARNLLLMDVNTGNFSVAAGVDLYMRYPKEQEPSAANSTYGIEWGHGIYLSATPSTIDFRYIRQEYGTPERIEDLASYRNMLENKFKQYQKMSKDNLLSSDIKSVVTNAMYEEFGTGKPDTFMERLESGRYDDGFNGTRKSEKAKVI
ncbi:MAG TPA: hypothetical protein VJY54_11590 [Lachnospiraceae bacterium]|nr:hypothetical protein [Lachnospiraceae bacterium]